MTQKIILSEQKIIEKLQRLAKMGLIKPLLLLIILITAFCPQAAFAATKGEDPVRDHIWLYNQGTGGAFNSKALKGNETMGSAGCGIYSIANAYQWLSNQKLSSSEASSLLDVLISKKNDPWIGSLDTYYNYMKSKGVIKKTTGKLSSQQAYEDLFAQGGVVILHPSGHYSLAVGMTKRDLDGDGTTEAYVHIVDSKLRATLGRLKKDGNKWVWNDHEYKTYYFSSFKKLKATIETVGTGKEFDKCGEYWMAYSNFKSIAEKCLYPKNPIVYKVDSISLNNTVYSLNLSDTLTLNVTAYPAGASNSVTWSSSDESVATVSTSGVVTPHKAGCSVTITARSTSDTNVTASCLVTTYYQQESGTLKFTGIKYPHTYVKNISISWQGKVESDVDLKSIVINLYTATNKYTQSASIPSGCKSYEMSKFGDSLFKNVSTGKFAFELIATDVMGRKLAFENNQCEAKTSGSHVYYDAPGTYSRPTLKGSAERNGHRYEVYESGARIWDYDRDFAVEKGGHLVTISDAEENQFVCDLVVASGGTYAYTGGYYDSGWRWVDGSPFNYTAWRSDVAADSDIIYSAVAGLAQAKQYTWGKASNTEMKNFVVEYDPIQVSSIVLGGTDNMTVDETQILPTTILPEDAYNQDIIYTSSDPSIATVNATTGLVTAMSEGNVTIYATAQDGSGVVGQFTLFVMHKPIPVTGLSVQANGDLYIDSKKIRLFEGEEASLQITITPLNADDKGVYFESDNTDIADFEPYSNDVTAISAGTCRLWCYTSNDQFSDYIDIEVAPLSGECGDNLTWAYEDRTLTISGTGAMYNYENRYSTPWFPLTDSVDIIAIGNEVSSIGDNAFSHFNNVTSIAIPSSITVKDSPLCLPTAHSSCH